MLINVEVELACTGKFCDECFWASLETDYCTLFNEDRTFSQEEDDYIRLPACLKHIKHVCDDCGCKWTGENPFCPNLECPKSIGR